jgi:hypothetical protein
MAKSLGFHRQALHAHRVHFDAPEFKRSFTATLPADMVDLMAEKMSCSAEELSELIA